MASVMKFDLEPHVEPVTIGGVDYFLKEASGDAACKWKNTIMKSTKIGPDGKPVGIDGLADSEPILVSLCLVEADKDGSPSKRHVSVSTIRSWPARIQTALFEKAKEISGLNDEETEEVLEKRLQETEAKLLKLKDGVSIEDTAKNTRSATTAGSV